METDYPYNDSISITGLRVLFSFTFIRRRHQQGPGQLIRHINYAYKRDGKEILGHCSARRFGNNKLFSCTRSRHVLFGLLWAFLLPVSLDIAVKTRGPKMLSLMIENTVYLLFFPVTTKSCFNDSWAFSRDEWAVSMTLDHFPETNANTRKETTNASPKNAS